MAQTEAQKAARRAAAAAAAAAPAPVHPAKQHSAGNATPGPRSEEEVAAHNARVAQYEAHAAAVKAAAAG